MAADESPGPGPPDALSAPALQATALPGAAGPGDSSAAGRTTLAEAPDRGAGRGEPAGFAWAVAGYEVLGELGRGGMGVVYQAHDTALQRVVAIKVLPRPGVGDPLELARFRIEAETMAAVSHPNVVTVYHIREAAGRPYIVMEYVNGGSLAARLRREGWLPPAEAARVVAAVARGVAAAHEQGVVHRDLKPGNVLLHRPARRDPAADPGSGPPSAPAAAGPPPEQPKVADFGLARRGPSNDVTRTGALLGTPAYMAPEQATGQNGLVGPATDVYALGVILYECLSGRPPFQGEDHWAVLRQVVDADPPPLRRARPGTPRDLELICGRCLAKDPRDRYASADAVADDLANFLAGRPVSVRPVSPLEAGRKWARRNPALARMAAVLALAALTLAALGVRSAADRRDAADRDRQARAELAAHEQQALVLAAQGQAAERAAADAWRLARAQRFYRQLADAQARRADPTPGWTLAALSDVAELAAGPEAAAEAGKLRDLAAAALAAPDVEECAPWLLPESGAFSYPSLLAAHPTEPLVAVARFGYAAPDLRLTVWLVDWRTGAARALTAPVWLSQITIDGHKESPDGLVFQPDGQRLYLVTRRGNVFSWGLNDPAAPPRPEPRLAGVGPLAIRPGGRGFWKVGGRVLSAHDDAGRRLAARTLDRKATALSYAAGADRLVVAAPDWVKTLDPDDLTEVASDLATRDQFTSAAVAPDGRAGVVAAGNEVRWADFALGRVTGTLDRGQDFPGDVVEQPVFSPDGALVAVPREHSHSLQLFAALTGRLVATVRTPERTHAPPVAFSADGTRLFVGGQDRLRIFRLRPGALRPLAVAAAPVSGVALDPTGRVLVTHSAAHLRLGDGAGATASRLEAWDTRRPGGPAAALRAVNLFGGHYTPAAPSFQPDGPWLAFGVGRAGGLWNLDTGEHRDPTEPADEPAVFAPGGRLWRGGKGATATEVPGGRRLAAFADAVERGVSGPTATGVLFAAADGLLVGTATGTLNWLGPGGRSLGRWKAGGTAVTAAARRPGGDAAFVGLDSGAAGVYRLPGGEPLAAWEAHRGRVSAAAWLGPDDLLTGGADRQIHLWHCTDSYADRVWSVRTAAGVRQLVALPDGRVAVLEEGARGLSLLDVPGFHADLAAAVPTEPLDLAEAAAAAESPLPFALREPPGAPTAGLRAEYFAVRPDSDERLVVATGYVPGLPGAAAAPHRDLPGEWFVARYRGFAQSAAAGSHTLTASASGEVKVWLDGSPVDGPGEFALPMTGQPQTLRVEWKHARGDPRLSLAWKSPTAVKLTPDRP